MYDSIVPLLVNVPSVLANVEPAWKISVPLLFSSPLLLIRLPPSLLLSVPLLSSVPLLFSMLLLFSLPALVSA
ncbi:hypothetical protein PMIT1320_00008 [Prochlorococcus marinus str. MIT 1320]|nr:hypothetical protein PMIT1320_00008 [Prochlorococcus marinus str. MIT 1320]